MSPHRIRRLAAPSVAALALVAVTACGAQQNDGDADAADANKSASQAGANAVPADAPAAALAADKDRERVDPDIFVADLRAALAEAETGHLVVTADLFGTPFEVSGDVDFRGDTPAVAGVVSGGMAGEGTEVRLVDGVLYAKVPGISDGKFLKLDLGSLGSFGGLGEIDSMSDPLAALDEYSDVISSVTLVGTDTIDGEPTEHYRVRLDPAKLKKHDRMSAGHELPKNVAFDVWVGADDNLVRKLVVDLPRMGDLSLRASDWGQDVKITAPKPSEVTDLTLGDLLGDLSELGAGYDS
ncbi:hypothetical protein [Nocardioides speluncae]|uniref:hypothetical protein n=1 Tax=Nocardioides speluncae TaxID=2670337 RepID=UPI000D69C955|nr:hypothetical protein [Nocardioides speluncae]